MKATGGSEAAKRRAGEQAAEEVSDGMLVGLGTGSTIAYTITALGAAVDRGLDITGVPSSIQTRSRARDAGIPLVELEDCSSLDVTIDGADQIHKTTLHLIKGGGAAHTREKLIAVAADRVFVVADETKLTAHLDYAVPVEVLPAARTIVAEEIREQGGTPELREATRKDGPVVTDNGNLILDCDFGKIDDPAVLKAHLSSLPGVLDHGLFIDIADVVYVGNDTDVEVMTTE